MKIKLKDIQPNPFRAIERYPIRPEKVAALRESIRTTGFWDNMVGRKVTGGAQVAYGHHRMAALRQEFDPDHEIDLIIRPLDDSAMLKIMARENMEEWGTSAAIEQETVRAVVLAYAAGQIELEEPDQSARKAQIRYAPSFKQGGPEDTPSPAREYPYTARTVGKFLGWMRSNGEAQEKVINALAALEFIEEGLLSERDFDDLTTEQARAVISEARKARERREDDARAARDQARAAEKRAAEAEARAAKAAKEAQEAKEREQKAAEERRLRQQQARAAEAERNEKLRQQREAQAAEAKRKEEAAIAARERAEVERKEARSAGEVHKQVATGARKKVEEHRAAGKRAATAVGREVSRKLKAKEITHKGAAAFAGGLQPRQEVPPDIVKFLQRLMSDIAGILRDPDPRVAKLNAVVQHKEHIADLWLEDAVKTLRSVAARFEGYAVKLTPKKVGAPIEAKATSQAPVASITHRGAA